MVWVLVFGLGSGVGSLHFNINGLIGITSNSPLFPVACSKVDSCPWRWVTLGGQGSVLVERERARAGCGAVCRIWGGPSWHRKSWWLPLKTSTPSGPTPSEGTGVIISWMEVLRSENWCKIDHTLGSDVRLQDVESNVDLWGTLSFS